LFKPFSFGTGGDGRANRWGDHIRNPLMGVWGFGIFDNDDASGFIEDMVCALSETIKSDLAALESERHPNLIRPTVAAVACLRALVKEIDTAKYSLQRNEAESWRDMYLEWFDRVVAPAWEPKEEGTIEYRRNVKREFTLLIKRLEEDRG